MWSLSLLAINPARNVHPHANASEWACKLFLVRMQFTARAGIPCTQQGACGWLCDRRVVYDMYMPQFSCIHLCKESEWFNVEQLQPCHSKQLRAVLDISSCTGFWWKRTELCAPPTLFAISFQIQSFFQLQSPAPEETLRWQQEMCSPRLPSLLGRVRVGTEEWEAKSRTLKGFALIMKPCVREVA